MKYKDIYTEAPANPDTLSMLGPIAPLAGKWFGDDGVDTHPQAGGPETEPYMTLAIPRGQIAMAEGTAMPGDREIRLHAERGQMVNGICSNPFLEEAFLTKSWDVVFKFHEDGRFSYEQVTKLEIPGVKGEFEHTDANTMRMIEAPRPNPAMIEEGLLNRCPKA